MFLLSHRKNALGSQEDEFESAMVNEPSVFEPLKFYCKITMYIKCLISFFVCSGNTGLGGSVGCASDWWSGGCGFDPARSTTFFHGNLIMNFFTVIFSTFRWFKKDTCQFLAKECAQHCFFFVCSGNIGLGGSVGCASDWWSGGCGFDPRRVDNILSWAFDHEIFFYGHSLPSADSKRAVVSFWRKNVHNTG